MDSGYVGIAGAGVCLPVAGDLAELATCLAKGDEPDGVLRLPGVPDTDLGPVQVRAALCTDPAPAVAPRKLPRECRLALAAAATALADPPAADGVGVGVGTVWVSSTAGMDEYGQICVEAATLPPGLVSPMVGPQAAYNGPASAVSIRLGLTGPQLTLTGAADAGAAAFVEAGRLLDQDRCASVVVGGSATVSRWRPGSAGGPVLAEGAVALLLRRADGTAPIIARPLRRARLGPSDVEHFVDLCLAGLRRPPDIAVVSATAAWRDAVTDTLDRLGIPAWYAEQSAGDLGAAGGLLAIAAGVAACGAATPTHRGALVLTVGAGGNAVAIDILAKEC